MKLESVASGLNQAKAAAAAKAKPTSESGQPLDIPVSDIQENPNNPRAEFEPVALKELADDIAASHVISPVSVFKSKAGSAKPYTLNYGARRLKASKIANKATIPAFVTNELDAYQRVAENEQRENLTALELATFIQSRLPIDKTLSAIAKKLGKSLAIVGQHNSLNDAQDAVKTALATGRITSTRTAVDLIALYKTHDNEALDLHIAGMDSIGRGDIESIAEKVPVMSRHNPLKKAANSRNATKNKTASKVKPVKDKNKPIVTVSVGGKAGRVVLNRPTKSDAQIYVLFDGTKTPELVNQSDCSDIVFTHALTKPKG